MKTINNIVLCDVMKIGGTASVYLAIDTNTGTRVAVKVLLADMANSQAIKRLFLKEANHYIYLNHPNIVRLKDFIQKDDESYLVMEFIEGLNLQDYIQNVTGPIPERKAAKMLHDVLAGVHYAHTQKVLHLDLKPSNIMLTPKGVIKVIDFGISTTFFEAKGGFGSPLYMSPEQTMQGQAIDQTSDIYSAGITFFQMLTGVVPFDTNMSQKKLFEEIQNGNIPKANTVYPFISVGVQHILDKATHVDKKKRYQSAAEFADALNPFL